MIDMRFQDAKNRACWLLNLDWRWLVLLDWIVANVPIVILAASASPASASPWMIVYVLAYLLGYGVLILKGTALIFAGEDIPITIGDKLSFPRFRPLLLPLILFLIFVYIVFGAPFLLALACVLQLIYLALALLDTFEVSASQGWRSNYK